MISKEWIEYLSKYSFIDKSERKGGDVYLYYTVKGEQKIKCFPVRVTGKHVVRIVNKIRKEMGVSIYDNARYGDYFII